jgi:phosphoribosylglycinamide formyltransferase 1
LPAHVSAISVMKNPCFKTKYLLQLYNLSGTKRFTFYYMNYAFAGINEASTSTRTIISPIRLAIFASGQGTNTREIIRYFHEAGHLVLGRRVEISLIVCNKPGAGVMKIADQYKIPMLLVEKEKFFRGSHYLEEFVNRNISFIVLAGFLWKIPKELIRVFPDRILNIHPALLPAYGGKGMYGNAVFDAVVAARERESGISIHYVDELYDHGRIFFQVSFNLSPEETAESLAKKIHELEYRHYPEQIARWLECKLSLNS